MNMEKRIEACVVANEGHFQRILRENCEYIIYYINTDFVEGINYRVT